MAGGSTSIGGGGGGGPSPPPPPEVIKDDCLNCVRIVFNSGAQHRNSTRCGALQFNGWNPDSATISTLDGSSPALTKGYFGFGIGVNTRLKWGDGSYSSQSKFKNRRDGYKWFKEETKYAVKHFRGSSGTQNQSQIADVKFYLTVESDYKAFSLPSESSPSAPSWGAYLNFRRPSLGSGGFYENPPWSEINTAISEIKFHEYLSTSEVWVPPSGGVGGHYKPSMDYWRTITVTLSPSGECSYEVEYLDPKEYDKRDEYTANFSEDGYEEWQGRVQAWNPYDAKWWFKETGQKMDSSSTTLSDNYVRNEWGMVCHDEEVPSYDYDSPETESLDESEKYTNTNWQFLKVAWEPDDNTYCYNYNSQSIKIRVWAQVSDSCHPWYFQGLTYSLSLRYKTGTCEMTYEGEGDSYLSFTFDGEDSEDFEYTFPQTQNANDNTFLVKTIHWTDLDAGTCRHISDFELNSITQPE